MKKNRKRTRRMSVTASRTMHFLTVILMLFVIVIVNMIADSRCDQIKAEIGKKENLLAKLEQDRLRESGRWDQIVNTSENLDRVLLKLGMSMKYARPEQVVYMDRDGKPEPGQVSVARAAQMRSSRTAGKPGGSTTSFGTTRRRR